MLRIALRASCVEAVPSCASATAGSTASIASNSAVPTSTSTPRLSIKFTLVPLTRRESSYLPRSRASAGQQNFCGTPKKAHREQGMLNRDVL